MNTKNILKITELIGITVIVSMVNLPFTVGAEQSGRIFWVEEAGNYLKSGYKPVPDIRSYIKDKLNDNFRYKEWCEETFDNGSYVYEAYKNIAFNIRHTPEPIGADFWQTPMETVKLKKGDCEDITFSFFSGIPSSMKNAEIVWGWIIDKRTKTRWAHVWYQLTDKKGLKYVVEGFSNDWNGIIPMDIIQAQETRNPIFIISHSMLNKLSRLLPKAKDWKMCQVLVDLFADTSSIMHVSGGQSFGMNTNIQRHLSLHEFIEYPESIQVLPEEYIQDTGPSHKRKMQTGINKEVSNILEKLHGLFSRYKEQKGEIENKRIW